MTGQLSWARDGETLALRGELDQDLLVPLWEARAQATDGVSSIDLSAVTRVDTAGLALLVHFIALIRRQGGEAKLTGQSENLQTLVRLYNLPADMRQIYNHLINGVSNMLPFVIGGGILIALAFMFDMEFAGTAKFGSGTPLAGFFKNIGGLAFSMMMPILAGYIAMSIGERPALMLGIVGGFLAASGGSGFFGALFAGFIGGYLILALRKVFSVLPDSLEGLKPILLYPVIGLLLMGILMTYVINPPTAAFNQWLAGALASMSTTSKVLMGFVLGAMMSIDFGGPLNKAAYVFGTASLAAADGSAVSSEIMAAVMIGGMVPPLAIALCTMLFKSKFTSKERQSGVTNFIMGLSFITEGAIPFAASDPLRVIPTCALGSGVAGALSMAFGCSVPAPHGGVFVFGVVQNWPMYFAALAAGSVLAAVLMGFVKNNVNE